MVGWHCEALAEELCIGWAEWAAARDMCLTHFRTTAFSWGVGPGATCSRLSWHLDLGAGGYRAGCVTGLNGDTTWYKYIFTAGNVAIPGVLCPTPFSRPLSPKDPHCCSRPLPPPFIR